jgi:hypothetical protein
VLHPIEKNKERSACYRQMRELTRIACLTLAFGLSHDTLDLHDFPIQPNPPKQKGLINSLNQDFLKRLNAPDLENFLNKVWSAFIVHVQQHKRPRVVAEWLWKKPVAIVKPLLELLIIPKERKESSRIIEMFVNDFKLLESFARRVDLSQTVGFNYLLTPITDQEVRKLVKEMMQNFYKRIFRNKTLIPTEVVGGKNPLNRNQFMSYFTDLSVCPACDGDHAPILEDELKTDADHFFPLSKYPFFAVHPLNIIPYCKYCNQAPFKLDKDVCDAQGVESLEDIFHPFRPARDKLRVNILLRAPQTRPKLVVLPESEQRRHQAQRESIIHLFDLERRWQGELSGHFPNSEESRSRMDRRLTNNLQHRIREAQQHAPSFSPNRRWLKKALESIVKQKYTDRGHIAYTITDQAYVFWVESHEETLTRLQNNLSTFYNGLNNDGANFEAASRLYASKAWQDIFSS